MSRLINAKMIYPFIAVILVIALLFIYKRIVGKGKMSEFGKYQGYSEAIYNGNKRISDYLTPSDGRRLAYDLILPTQKGVPAREPLPVLFKYTPYLYKMLFDKPNKRSILLIAFELIRVPLFHSQEFKCESSKQINAPNAM